MTHKLYLDDERPCPEGWTYAQTLNEAVVAASLTVFDEMSLDHDLGLHNGTGYEFVEWLAKTRRWPLRKPVVHSANPWGAKRMQELIDRCGPYHPATGLRTTAVPGHAEAAARVRAGHNDARPVPGTHRECPDPACCPCWCPGCVVEWRQAGRPMPEDCLIHSHRG